MRAIIILFGLTLLFPCRAIALSNADYEKFTQESPAFVQAEEKLSASWDAYSAAASREEFAVVLKEQREWNRKKRDSEAAGLVKSAGLSHADAYARTAVERAEVLDGYTKKSLSVVHHKDIAGTYGAKKDYVTITRKGDVYAVQIRTAGGEKAPDDWECRFEGETTLKDNVLSFTEPAFTVTISANGSVATVADLPNNEVCGIRGTANGNFRR